ncbi:hypothetical protein ACUXQ2_006490, partial [Cupriavidus metallidurans]
MSQQLIDLHDYRVRLCPETRMSAWGRYPGKLQHNQGHPRYCGSAGTGPSRTALCLHQGTRPSRFQAISI